MSIVARIQFVALIAAAISTGLTIAFIAALALLELLRVGAHKGCGEVDIPLRGTQEAADGGEGAAITTRSVVLSAPLRPSDYPQASTRCKAAVWESRSPKLSLGSSTPRN
jgi:hypothetical protein